MSNHLILNDGHIVPIIDKKGPNFKCTLDGTVIDAFHITASSSSMMGYLYDATPGEWRNIVETYSSDFHIRTKRKDVYLWQILGSEYSGDVIDVACRNGNGVITFYLLMYE